MDKRFLELREFFKLSQEDIGQRIGVTKSTISLIERGQRNASERLIRDICREFNINEEWLRTGKGEMKKNMTLEEEIYGRFGKIMEKSSPVKKEIASMLIQIVDTLPDEEWEYIYGEFKKCIQRIEEAKREED